MYDRIILHMPHVYEIFDLMPKAPLESDKELILKAAEFAKVAHKDQKRANGDPYFVHLIETAKNLARFGMDPMTISAGLLHDTLEDTSVTEEELTENFGKEITFLVKGITKLGKLKYTGVERHVESLRKFFLASAEDVRVIIIKLADRLHNVQTLEFIPEEKRKRIALETIEIYAPLANRLGMGKLKGDLEDYAFPFAYPKEYALVTELMNQKTDLTEKRLDEIHREFSDEMKKHDINVLQTDYRIKHKYSLYKKLVKHEMDIDKIYDIVALRVVVPTVEDCYRVLGIVHGLWTPLPGRIKDYIAIPKPNGYKSIHTTIFNGSGGIAEIQIRTPEMHSESEYGVASHFAYKEHLRKKTGAHADKNLAWIDQLTDFQKAIAKPESYLESLKIDFFQDRIFIFTPKGDIIDLPEGSSTIDFAFAVHTGIGLHAAGAKVNGKFSALKTILKSNDIVHIETKKEAHPTSSWLEYAKTALAKRQIKAYLIENSLLERHVFSRFRK
jgi:GTP diphosphokinase / guanosine-3',5'-bis(diphosphate) 3'-diphosphatase